MAKKTQKDEGGELKASAHKIWLAGLGALSVAEEEGSKLFKRLVERGETFEARLEHQGERAAAAAKGARARAERVADTVGGTLEESVASVVQRLGVPTRSELQALGKRIEELTAKIDKVSRR